MVCLQPNGQKFSWFVYKPLSRTEVFMVCLIIIIILFIERHFQQAVHGALQHSIA